MHIMGSCCDLPSTQEASSFSIACFSNVPGRPFKAQPIMYTLIPSTPSTASIPFKGLGATKLQVSQTQSGMLLYSLAPPPCPCPLTGLASPA